MIVFATMKHNPRRKSKPIARMQGFQWTPEKYWSTVHGGKYKGTDGEQHKLMALRDVAHGFEKRQGFDKPVSKWTPKMRRRVRDYVHKIRILTAQDFSILRPRSQSKIDQAADVLHRGIAGEWKVVFMPDVTPPAGMKRPPRKVTIGKGKVTVEHKGLYEITRVAFDKKALVKNARKEIKRVVAMMPGQSLYSVQVGEFDYVRANTLYAITQLIQDWMSKYDGVKPLPDSSGNRGDNPKHHKWDLWLDKMIGYKLPGKGSAAQMEMKRLIVQGRRQRERERQEETNYLRRKRHDAQIVRENVKQGARQAVKSMKLKASKRRGKGRK